jgi:hypothetical protein
MRADPLLLVLDEPTSALDAHTEHALFERYAAAARQGRRTGTGRPALNRSCATQPSPVSRYAGRSSAADRAATNAVDSSSRSAMHTSTS